MKLPQFMKKNISKYMNRYFILALLIPNIFFSQSNVDIKKLSSDYALKASRDEFKIDLGNKVNYLFRLQLDRTSEAEWISTFREIGLMKYRSDKVHDRLVKASGYSHSSSIKFQRALVEVILSLYSNEFMETVDSLFKTTNDATLFSYCVNYFSINPKSNYTNKYFLEQIKIRFPNWESIPQLKFLKYYLLNEKPGTPSLTDLLSYNVQDGKTIIYSLHRKDRKYPGITIIKKPDGSFVQNPDSSIFYVEQLALSSSGLPGYLSQGNSPQGIFSIVGFYVSPTPSIGPTPNVLTRIPYEVDIDLFYHGKVESINWLIKDYQNLLPKSWQEYLPIYEAFYAGKTGRRKIVMHGSVDDLNFYKNEPYSPLTPSKGCLTTKEVWSEKTGKSIESDQAKLMNAFFSTGQLKGFLVVLDIDDKKIPVSIDEILPFLTPIQTLERNSHIKLIE